MALPHKHLQIAVITPNVTLCIIRDYEVVEKKEVILPETLIGLVKCSNPKCICNNEPMATRFHVIDSEKRIVKCSYCNHETALEKMQLI